MRVVFLSDTLTVLLCFIIWGVYQSLVSFICFKIPDKFYNPNSFIFRTYKWEKNGKIYSRFFKVEKWKKYLPDGGAVVKGGYRKKNLENFSKTNLEKFVVESCRGEVSHWIAIFPFWVFGFIAPIFVLIPMFIYAMVVNMPCIITQRYNRPRFMKILDKS